MAIDGVCAGPGRCAWVEAMWGLSGAGARALTGLSARDRQRNATCSRARPSTLRPGSSVA